MTCSERSFWHLREDYWRGRRKMRSREPSSEDAAVVQMSDGVLRCCRGMVVERGGLPYLGSRIKDDDWIWEWGLKQHDENYWWILPPFPPVKKAVMKRQDCWNQVQDSRIQVQDCELAITTEGNPKSPFIFVNLNFISVTHIHSSHRVFSPGLQ